MTTTGTRNKWLLRRPSDDAAARLFCFPYSGCGASMYNRWPENTGPVEILPVQLPARERRIREPHFGTYQELAELAVSGLTDFLDRPFGFFGHCGGALAAFATSARLREVGGPAPTALFVSSEVAPHDGPFGRFLDMSEGQLRVELQRLASALGTHLDRDMLDLCLETLVADIAANRKYELDAPFELDCDVHAIGWLGDTDVWPDQMSGWEFYAKPGRYFADVLDGTHHTFLDAPEALLGVFTSGMSRTSGVT
jgi:surfactin synthase thioesterase subunit